MNRSRAKAGNRSSVSPRAACLAALLMLSLAGNVAPVRAQTAVAANDFWFGGTRLVFDHPQLRGGQVAVATDDSGLVRFLGKLGAVLAYQPGQNAIVVTAGDRRIVSFTLGDPHVTIAGTPQAAAFAPYAAGASAYLPFLDLARALFVDPVSDGATTVMQPQIATLDVRSENRTTIVTLAGATPLQFKRLSAPDDDDVSIAFYGTASTLENQRTIDGVALKTIGITVEGTPKNPLTIVTFIAASGSVHALVAGESPSALTLAFAPAGTQLGGSAVPAASHAAVAAMPPSAAAPTLPPYGDPNANGAADGTVQPVPAVSADAPTPTAYGLPPATLSAIDTQSHDDGLDVRLTISGNVTYEWHRLSDNRWYIDLKPATLTVGTQDQPLDDPAVVSLRVKPFVGPNDHLPTVRVALTLSSPRVVNLVPTGTGLTLAIGAQDDSGSQKVGMGELLPGRLYTGIVPLPPIQAPASMTGADENWKFGRSAATNPKLIVIDPGHGGSDSGAEHNGLVEKDLNLDISKRLRAILLARGWQVKMTRDSDVDVFGPNASAHDELQARDDVANRAGARMYVSVHTNSFTSSSLNGTTTYYFRPDSYPLAQAVHARLAALPTKDDGIRKDNFYVIHHATMPAILVETAFLSNPGDAGFLKSGAFLQRIAGCIADGIEDYASNSQPLSDSPVSGGI
jgi:N-acetylmuramoyl-L-alanine amidase